MASSWSQPYSVWPTPCSFTHTLPSSISVFPPKHQTRFANILFLSNHIMSYLPPLISAPAQLSHCCYNNYYKLSGLKQNKFIILRFWRSKSRIHFPGLKAGCWYRGVPFGGSGGESISILFSFIGCSHSLACGNIPLTTSSIITLFLWPLPSCLPLIRNLVMTKGPFR